MTPLDRFEDRSEDRKTHFNLCHGLTPAGSSAPHSSSLTLLQWGGERISRGK